MGRIALVHHEASNPDTSGFLFIFLTKIGLHIDVLTHDQTVALFQFYIEGIIGAAGGVISTAISIHTASGALRILCIDLGYFSFPGPVIDPGVDQHVGVHVKLADILFVDRPLDPVIADLHDRDEIIAVTVVIGTASIVDLLDDAADPALDFCIVNIAFQLFDLCLFDLNVQFLVLEREILLLDLNCIIGLFRRRCAPLLLLQLRNGFLCALVLIMQPFQINFSLLQILFILVRTIGKENVALLYLVAFRHMDFVDIHFTVLGHGPGPLRFHNAGKAVDHAKRRVLSGQVGNRLHISDVVCAAVSSAGTHENDSCCEKHDNSCCKNPLFIF